MSRAGSAVAGVQGATSGGTSGGPIASVIVCTLKRLEPLKRCLAALRAQRFGAFEMVVAVGPGDEPARAFLAGQADLVVIHVDRANVSAARNAAVAVSRAPIIAFCDDDAVAGPDWLGGLAAGLAESGVGAAGGTVYDSSVQPPRLAFANGIVRLSGRQIEARDRPGQFNDPAGPWYNYVVGCCMAVRRDALESVGGFDEFMEYAYEETDVCVRLIRAGWRVAHVPEAVVWHGLTEGVYRGAGGRAWRKDWRVHVKNQLYFGLKNRTGSVSALRSLFRAAARTAKRSALAWIAAGRGELSASQAGQYCRQMRQGLLDGLRAGTSPRLRRR